jgi:hypothetical protein
VNSESNEDAPDTDIDDSEEGIPADEGAMHESNAYEEEDEDENKDSENPDDNNNDE